MAAGGGSVVYASTLYRASPEFFVNPQWAGINDWSAALAPHDCTAEKMLGVQMVPHESDGQNLLREIGRHFGVEDSLSRTPVGVFFCKPGKTVPDPYFEGEGPERTGCTRCGACMVGCREGAKNTLVKNYLWFAEKRGIVFPPVRLERTSCWPGASSAVRCRGSAAGSASSCAPTVSPYSP